MADDTDDVGRARRRLARVPDPRRQLSRVTNDHSWVFEQVQAGMLTEAEAEKHPLRNVITRALGGALQVTPDASEIESEGGRCLPALLGRPHRHGSEDEILRVVTASTATSRRPASSSSTPRTSGADSTT
jgi:hypothetical protein